MVVNNYVIFCHPIASLSVIHMAVLLFYYFLLFIKYMYCLILEFTEG